jgi:uncharacterized protein YdcH (DUF465 family)
MKTYEICFLGKEDSKSYHYDVCHVVDELGNEAKTEKKNLFFPKKVIPDLSIGDYLTATSENEQTFSNFKRLLNPAKTLDDSIIQEAIMKQRAKELEVLEIKKFRVNVDLVEKRIGELRQMGGFLSKRERSLFALYVYQKLL